MNPKIEKPLTEQPLADKVIVVTGAAQGLGAAIARGLAAAGARIVMTDIDAEALQQQADDVRAETTPDSVLAIVADAADHSAADRLVGETKARFGAIHVLINNAGLGPGYAYPDFLTAPTKFWQVDPARWRRVIEVNAIGPFYLAHAVAPHLVAQGWGRIVNVTTTFQTMLRYDAYGPAKAALEAHTAIAANALAGTGVTINIVVTGGPADTAQVPDSIGVARDQLLPPSVMVPPISWLCSDAASSINGLRIAAARWDAAGPAIQAVANASEPVAWPQLVTPITLPQGAQV